MAQAAEEYGSHDKTFEIAADGRRCAWSTPRATTLLEHAVEPGDIWRVCQTKDAPIRDWVKLAVNRARATGCHRRCSGSTRRARTTRSSSPKVEQYLKRPRHRRASTSDPLAGRGDARSRSSACARGEDTISVTGNVLRDYLTDLFPILELGTSAKMLSIVPLMRGRRPVRDGRGRLGAEARPAVRAREPPALGLARRVPGAGRSSLELLAAKTGNARAAGARRHARRGEREVPGQRQVAVAQGRRARQPRQPLLPRRSTGRRRSPRRSKDAGLEGAVRADRGRAHQQTSQKIVGELNAAQGKPVNVGGYYHPDAAKCAAALRPSATLNAIVDPLR